MPYSLDRLVYFLYQYQLKKNNFFFKLISNKYSPCPRVIDVKVTKGLTGEAFRCRSEYSNRVDSYLEQMRGTYKKNHGLRHLRHCVSNIRCLLKGINLVSTKPFSRFISSCIISTVFRQNPAQPESFQNTVVGSSRCLCFTIRIQFIFR